MNQAGKMGRAGAAAMLLAAALMAGACSGAGTDSGAGVSTAAAAAQSAESAQAAETQAAAGDTVSTAAASTGSSAGAAQVSTAGSAESAQVSTTDEYAMAHTASTGSTITDEERVIAQPSDDWRLLVVNPWNKLPENYEVETEYIQDGQSFDSRAADAMRQMIADCQKAGGTPILCSGYRAHSKQVYLFDRQIAKWEAQGYGEEEATEQAGTVVAIPGTSEHELGLAMDIYSSENQNLDDSQEDTMTQQWLMANSWRYGFVLRYPKDKTDVTGIIYEPWHYRFVGVANAAVMHRKNLCLEEYVRWLAETGR